MTTATAADALSRPVIHDISTFANHPMMDTEDSLGPPLRNVLGSYYGHAVASPTAPNRTLLTRVAREFRRQSGKVPAILA